MIEVLWNGRGGQGAFTAAKILGAAWVLKNDRSFALAFPSFGPERRGAPVRAFNKLGYKPINNRSEIKESDFIVYLDDTLFSDAALSGLKADGKIILNTTKQFTDKRIITINADKIANDILNRPIANTAMLGVLSAACEDITLPEIEKAVAAALPERQVAGNIAVVKAAKAAVR
jgi:pyruvate ferredoxin oxidoreductase gamma subunit